MDNANLFLGPNTSSFFYPSGGFVFQPEPWKIGDFTLTPKETSVYNVMTIPLDSVVSISGVPHVEVVTQISKIIGEKLDSDNVRKFTIDDLYSYQDNLIRVAVELENFAPAVVLVPMRGGLKPRQIVDGLLNYKLPFAEFKFTRKSDPHLAKVYANELRAILAPHSAKNRDLRIGVLDAGIGGDSANILAKLLVKIHEELGGLWRVNFHILHEDGRPTDNFAAVTRKKAHGIRFRVTCHAVSHLLVEDWAPGIGLKTERNGEDLFYKPSIKPGAVFVTRKDGTCFLTVAPDVCKAVNKTISILGTERMFGTLKRDPSRDVYESYGQLFG